MGAIYVVTRQPAEARAGLGFAEPEGNRGPAYPDIFNNVGPATLDIQKSALIGHPVASMFDVIEAAEHYPEFLPWCADATIITRDESVVVARITINYHGVRLGFTTRNPKRRPLWMAIQLEQGPFRRFEGEWRLTELAPDACKINFALRYEFDSALVGKLAGRVFDGIANTMVDAFANRAEQTLGRQPQGAIDTRIRPEEENGD